jgi:glutamyl-tRNA reductase
VSDSCRLAVDAAAALFSGNGDDRQGDEDVPRLTGLSFAHPVVPSGDRAALSFEGGSLRELHRRLRAAGHEAFLLSTCLRVEIAWAGPPDDSSAVLTSIYGQDSMSGRGLLRTDAELFLHLCRLAAGLESPALGETEVFSQFRRGVSAFSDEASGNGDLSRSLGAAVGIGRDVRRHLGSEAASMASAAATTARSSARVAILGAGAMARATARLLPADSVTVFSRRPDSVAGRDTEPWDQTVQALEEVEVLISTVPGRVQLFPEREISAALAKRTEPLLLIDLAMPPGFERHRRDPAIVHMGVDEIASSVQSTPRPDLEELVAKEAGSAWARLNASDRVGMVIAAIVDGADHAVDEEVRRFAGRLPDAADPEAIMHQLAHTVVRRVLHRPISYAGSSEDDSDALRVLAEAFGVTDE